MAIPPSTKLLGTPAMNVMMERTFPQKEIYVCTFSQPLREGQISAVNGHELSFPDYFLGYSDARWDVENRGRVSSVLPSAVEVESDQGGRVIIHCGLTEYKYILGQVKLASELGKTGRFGVHGLSTEILSLTLDRMFMLERRNASSTQHAVGFYDLPGAGQHAEIYLQGSRERYPGLVRDMFDMFGFPRYNLIRGIGLEEREIGDISFVGFSSGFEVSLDSQFNGYTNLDCEGRELLRRLGEGSENKRMFRFEDVLDVLDMIGNDGRSKKLKRDIRGWSLGITELTGGFGLVDDTLGTLLSVLWHLDRGRYESALEILKRRGYQIREVQVERESKVVLVNLG